MYKEFNKCVSWHWHSQSDSRKVVAGWASSLHTSSLHNTPITGHCFQYLITPQYARKRPTQYLNIHNYRKQLCTSKLSEVPCALVSPSQTVTKTLILRAWEPDYMCTSLIPKRVRAWVWGYMCTCSVNEYSPTTCLHVFLAQSWVHYVVS